MRVGPASSGVVDRVVDLAGRRGHLAARPGAVEVGQLHGEAGPTRESSGSSQVDDDAGGIDHDAAELVDEDRREGLGLIEGHTVERCGRPTWSDPAARGARPRTDGPVRRSCRRPTRCCARCRGRPSRVWPPHPARPTPSPSRRGVRPRCRARGSPTSARPAWRRNHRPTAIRGRPDPARGARLDRGGCVSSRTRGHRHRRAAPRCEPRSRSPDTAGGPRSAGTNPAPSGPPARGRPRPRARAVRSGGSSPSPTRAPPRRRRPTRRASPAPGAERRGGGDHRTRASGSTGRRRVPSRARPARPARHRAPLRRSGAPLQNRTHVRSIAGGCDTRSYARLRTQQPTRLRTPACDDLHSVP